jgi:hypothetical protein
MSEGRSQVTEVSGQMTEGIKCGSLGNEHGAWDKGLRAYGKNWVAEKGIPTISY